MSSSRLSRSAIARDAALVFMGRSIGACKLCPQACTLLWIVCKAGQAGWRALRFAEQEATPWQRASTEQQATGRNAVMSMKMRVLFYTTAVVVGLAVAGTAGAADVTLKASHQWPVGQGDPRDEKVQIIAREAAAADVGLEIQVRSEEHTSELQSLMRISYAVFCLKQKTTQKQS